MEKMIAITDKIAKTLTTILCSGNGSWPID